MKNKILQLLLLLVTFFSYAAHSQQKLNSYTSATATIYLDFDGEEVNSPVWNNGGTINCAASNLTAAQITEIFNRVSEDYRPFNINITTDIALFVAAPFDKRIRVIVTPTSNWFTGVGGVALVGSFTWGDDTPCFVFSDRLGPNNAKMVAECCSHESGHTLGLSHQSKYDGSCNLTATYNDGNGSGEISWAPIMGNSYYRNMSGWNNGPTPYGCNNLQDNLSIITSVNGFTYRSDDYSDDINTAPTVINPLNINIDGLISSSTDKDAFTFTLAQNANFHLDAKPFSVNANNEGADLDIKISLYDASKNLIRTYNPASTMSVTIDSIFNAGTYFMVIDGTGNNNASDYGSLGSYSIKGISGVLPICSVNLTGAVHQNKHQLNWSLICNEAILNISIETSQDGTNFSSINTVDYRQTSFSYLPNQYNDIYYRLKITSSSGKVVYSNTILLKKANQFNNFIVSTFVSNTISINAAEDFQYHLFDVNGNSIAKGSGTAGFSKINMSAKVSGMYILQLADSNQQQTERIIKQ